MYINIKIKQQIDIYVIIKKENMKSFIYTFTFSHIIFTLFTLFKANSHYI